MALWRDRAVIGWAAGRAVSELGDAVWFVALTYAAARVGSAALAGLVVACATLPRAVLLLVGGALADRFDGRRLMIATDLARVAVLVGAVAAVQAYGAGAGLLVTVAILFGVADAVHGPASSAFPRQLVHAADLTRLAGLRQLLHRFSATAGAPLGGALVAAAGLTGPMLVDAASFLVIAGVIAAVRPRWPRALARGRSVVADVAAGLSYVRGTPRVRDLAIALSGLNVFVAPVTGLGLALRVTGQGWSPARLGILSGCIGAGAAAGTLLPMRWRPPRPIVVALAALAAQAVALGVVGVAPYPAALAAMTTVGVTAGIASPLLGGAVQATVDEQYLGRVSALLSLADDGLAPAALAGFGALAGLVGLAPACAASAAGFLALLAFAASRPHVRAITLPPPPAPPPAPPAPPAPSPPTAATAAG